MKKHLFTLLFLCITFLGFSTGHVVNTFVINNTTCGNPNGSVRATVSGGVGPFTYSWNTSPVQNNDTAFAVMAGSYTVTVTDQNDMSVSTGVITVTNTFNPITVIANGQNVACEGSMVTFVANATGGTGAISYLWTGPNGFTSTLQNPIINAWLGATGTYTVTATDVNACSSTSTFFLMVNPMPMIALGPQSVTCFGQCNGSIFSSVNPPGAYTYQWTGPTSSTMQHLTGICAGTYTLIVTDMNGCSNANSTSVNEPAPLTASIQTSSASSCNACDGSAISFLTGGSPAYSYTWSTGATTSSITNLCPGYYTLGVQDINGCFDSVGVFINASAIQATFNVVSDTCNQAVGAITANITNAVGNVTYNWMPGNYTTQSIANVQAGTYTLTVTDSICSFNQSVTVPNQSQISVVATPSTTVCGSSDGTIYVNASGANPPFQYSIDGTTFTSNQTFSNLSAAIYTITVRDNLGCINSTQAQVTNSSMQMAYFSTGNSTCTNNNGVSTAYAYNVNGPLSYLWQPGGQTTQTISNLAPGTYTCTITGSGGCAVTGTTTVHQQNNFYLAQDYDFYNCGINSLSASASFGQAPYTYAWQPGGQTTQTIVNQNIGNYICTVTDATGCIATGYYGIYNSYNTMISGMIYNDANSNCVYDSGDSLLPQWSVYAAPTTPGNGGWAWAQNGTYNMYLPNVTNTYSLTAYPPGGSYGNSTSYYQFNCGTTTAVINASCDTVLNVNIPVTSIPAQDLTIYNYCGTSRPGFHVSNYLSYSNVGTLSTANVVVTYDLDPLLTYIGSTPPASVVSGNHLEFNLGTLAPSQTGWITINAIVPTIQNGGALGTLINNSAAISIVGGEQTPSDNVDACTTAITGSYDPNEKEVYAENMSPSGAIDITGRKMYYTVHFQNTGTDTAFTITVRDTISNLLDLTSLELLTSSHAYTARILPDRTLELTFNNILLVDSNKNEALSHGYFNYSIHTKPGLVNGDNIANTAAIYFDFNLPIITNTVNTPVQTSVGIKETSNSLMASVFPNPLSNGDLNIKFNAALNKNVMMRIYGIGGNEVFTKQLSNNNQQSVNVAGLSAGIYFVRLSDEAGRSSDIKLVIAK